MTPEEAAKALRENVDALTNYLGSFDEHVREEAFWGRYGIEQRVHDISILTGRMNASLRAAITTIADLLEAQSPQTNGDANHD